MADLGVIMDFFSSSTHTVVGAGHCIDMAVALLTIWQRNVADQPIFKQIPVEPVLAEAALYEQPRLLQQALNSINPSTSAQLMYGCGRILWPRCFSL